MRIAVKAHTHQKEEWLAKTSAGNIEIEWTENIVPPADAYFDLCFEEYGPAFMEITDKPVFVNAVVETTDELPANFSRVNAWNGFLGRDSVEVVLRDDAAKKIIETLGWKYIIVPDVPGMIAPRTISMIINEAYFALGDEVSTKQEIDVAMRFGTNYPSGPFEWSAKIGLHNVYRLLKKLSVSDSRYLPSTSLEQELKAIA